MNYQQWQPLAAAPTEKLVAVNANAYIFRGTFYRRPNDDLYIVGPYGKIYECAEIQTWSWSDTEPEQEMLMVKPHGIFCAHWWNEIGHLLNIIADNDIKLFFELGILDGGFTALMLDRCRFVSGFRYVGINKGLGYVDSRVERIISNMEWPREQSAILHDADLWEPATVQYVSGKIQTAPGRTMVYCDGGDKKREAHLYWPILRPGDLLGVHDYSDNPKAVGPEVYFEDVSDIIAAGRRRGQDVLAETRILLVEKP